MGMNDNGMNNYFINSMKNINPNFNNNMNIENGNNPNSLSMDNKNFYNLNNNNNNNINSNNNNGPPSKEVLPRPNNFNPIPDNSNFAASSNMKNILFEASTGLKVMIKADINTTIKELLKMYIERIGLNESFIDKDIVFLFTGEKMDSKSEEKITKIPNMGVITVFDQNNVIGA